MAIYAYYLLFIGTVLSLIEHVRSGKAENNNDKKDEKI